MRHPQPRELAKLKGADKVHPERYRNEPPKSSVPLGSAADHLDEAAKAVWFELAAYCLPGVMTGADRIAFEALANLVADYRKDPHSFPTPRIGQMIGLLARFGMTPADRQKLGVEKTKDENPFASLDS